MAKGILIVVIVVSCLATFPLNGADAVWAFGIFLITLLWLVQWDEFEKEAPLAEGVKVWNLLLNLFYLIIFILILRYFVKH